MAGSRIGNRLVAKTSSVVRKTSKAAGKLRTKRPPIRLRKIKTGRIVNRLRELHELGGDPAYERFPASEELFLVPDHAQTWAGKLKQPKDSPVNVVGEVAVLRAKLWQYLREQADIGQLKAIEDGRAVGVPWTHFTEALCVASEKGAYQKARRLKAEQVREPGERRTPDVVREHEERAAAEDRAERALLLVQERRFPVAQQLGRLLPEQRDGIVLDSWAAYWLGEIAETIDDRDDPAKRARFTGWVESFVRGRPRTCSTARSALHYNRGGPAGSGTGHRVHLPGAPQDPRAAPAFPNWEPGTTRSSTNTRRPDRPLILAAHSVTSEAAFRRFPLVAGRVVLPLVVVDVVAGLDLPHRRVDRGTGGPVEAAGERHRGGRDARRIRLGGAGRGGRDQDGRQGGEQTRAEQAWGGHRAAFRPAARWDGCAGRGGG
jgi:hypothetical protein